MTSLEIYNDIKFNACKKSYVYLKTKYSNLIKAKFTINYCVNEAEDRFAFAYSKLYVKITENELQNMTNLSGYFLTICRNSFLIDAQRNKVKTVETLPEYNYNFCEDLMIQEETVEITKELIKTLPKQLRTISQKIYLEDKDHKEIAEELNINYQNVRKYQYKAIKLLQSKTPTHYREYIGNAA